MFQGGAKYNLCVYVHNYGWWHDLQDTSQTESAKSWSSKDASKHKLIISNKTFFSRHIQIYWLLK